MFMIFLPVCVDEDLSNLRSSSKDNRESDDLPISPRVLIDKLINLMVEWLGMRSDIREWYFAFFRSLLIFFSNFHFNNVSITYNYTSHYLRQCTIGCHSGTKKKQKKKKKKKRKRTIL